MKLFHSSRFSVYENQLCLYLNLVSLFGIGVLGLQTGGLNRVLSSERLAGIKI